MADDLNWLLKNLLQQVPRTRNAVLLTVDGLKKSWYGLSEDEADRLAATAGSLCGLANQIGMQLSGQRALRQVIVELDDCYFFVTAASTGSVLAVSADSTVEVSVLSLHMAHLCKQVASHFATQERAAATPGIGLR